MSMLGEVHSLIPLPKDKDVYLSAPSLAPLVRAYHHVSLHDNNGLYLKLLSQPNEMFSFIRLVMVMMSLHKNRNPN